MGIDGNWKHGRVWCKKLRTEDRAVTMYMRANTSSSELVCTGGLIQGCWNDAMDEASL